MQKGWSAIELSNATCLSKQQISHIERGERACSLDTFINIVNALQIPSDELLADNLVTSSSTRSGDDYYVLLDCTQEEATILIKNMKSLKEVLRTYTIK